MYWAPIYWVLQTSVSCINSDGAERAIYNRNNSEWAKMENCRWKLDTTFCSIKVSLHLAYQEQGYEFNNALCTCQIVHVFKERLS